MISTISAYWRAMANSTSSSLLGRLILALLIPLSLPYALIQRLRAGMYRSGILTTRRLPRPVISIGNITVGGTGKTPVTAYIARLLMAQGLKVAVLSRGYGGSLEGQSAIVSDGGTIRLAASECGDEPYLLASTIPGLLVIIGSDRHAAAQLAMEQLGPDIFLLDDGFQHLALKRDLNILLLDHSRPFGNGWTLPAGLLREPRDAAGRADLVIHTRCPAGDRPAVLVSGKPFCCARHDLADAIPLAGGEPFPLEALADLRLLAFAGIAEPQTFYAGLRARGLNVVATISFPDHAAYGVSRITEISKALNSSRADWAITTEKDGVKLHRLPEELEKMTLLARLALTIDDPTPLMASLRNLLQK